MSLLQLWDVAYLGNIPRENLEQKTEVGLEKVAYLVYYAETKIVTIYSSTIQMIQY